MNIFEGITKEKFIVEFNKEDNGCLSLLHLNLAFDYKGLKTKKKRYTEYISLQSITNIKDFEKEIEVFNSFEPFFEYLKKPVLIIENYNKYLTCRKDLKHKKLPETILKQRAKGFWFPNYENDYKLDDKYLVFQDIESFHMKVKQDEDKKLREQIEAKIKAKLTKSVREHEKKLVTYFEESLIDFSDIGYGFNIKIKFSKFEDLCRYKNFKEEHLTQQNLFDEFDIELYNEDLCDLWGYFSFEKKIIDNHLELIIEYLNTIKDIGECLGFRIIMLDLFKFHFLKKEIL